MKICNALVYGREGTFIQQDVLIENGLIYAVSPVGSLDWEPDEMVVDATGLYLIPGLTDLHFHGCAGYDLCDGTEEAIDAMARFEAKRGVTTICPATMTYSEEILTGICRAAAAHENRRGAALVGLNMEGPFISMEKRGAQNAAYVQDPDAEMFKRLQAEAHGLIRLVDLAPEKPGAMDFIKELHGEVICSLAHTTADYDTCMEAFAAGAGHVTHLYNAMPPYLHRAPGPVGAAADAPGCSVELICDGVHVHPAVVRSTFRMFGAERVILISDSMRACGMPDGDYSLGGQAVTVKGNLAALSDGTIAGSVTDLMSCLKKVVQEMGIPLETAVRCAAVNPARALGIYDRYGSIEPGKTANLVLLSQDLDVMSVILNGEPYREEEP